MGSNFINSIAFITSPHLKLTRLKCEASASLILCPLSFIFPWMAWTCERRRPIGNRSQRRQRGGWRGRGRRRRFGILRLGFGKGGGRRRFGGGRSKPRRWWRKAWRGYLNFNF
ncbi:unnamed protein product, partial [Vitis vinifera]